MSQLTAAAFRYLKRFRAENGISSPPASLSPPPPPEAPMAPARIDAQSARCDEPK